MHPRWSRAVPFCVVAACLAFAALVVRFAFAHWDSVYDDAFIYLRYVKHAHTCGLRWNCSDAPVEGFTGPLYLAILWVGSFATDQLIWLCQLVGTVCMIGAGVLAIVVASRLVTSLPHRAMLAVLAALVLGLDDFVTLNSVIGLESSLAALVVMLVVFAALEEKPWLLVGAACALVLVRPEGGVFLLALPVLPSLRRWKYAVASVGFLVGMTAVRYAIFGQVAPNTFYAKSGGSSAHLALGVRYVIDCVRDFPLVALSPLALFTSRRRPVTYVLVAAALWVMFFLRSGGDTFEYSRLLFPLVPALTVFALAGALAVTARRTRDALALAATSALTIAVAVRALTVHAIPAQHANERVVQWAAVGSYLRSHYPKGTLIATVPIGAIGYYSNLPLLDLVGLTEPAIARAGRSVPPELLEKRWIAHERNNTAYVLTRAPTVIVTTMVRDHAWRELAEARAGFWSDWLLLQEIKAGRAPYHVRDLELGPREHVLAFERD